MIADPKQRAFTAVNFHSADCGASPDVLDDGQGPNYHGYFVNRQGEQWIVSIDPTTKSGILRGGDVGWDQAFQIANGKVDADLILAADERIWLDACWLAACGSHLPS